MLKLTHSWNYSMS